MEELSIVWRTMSFFIFIKHIDYKSENYAKNMILFIGVLLNSYYLVEELVNYYKINMDERFQNMYEILNVLMTLVLLYNMYNKSNQITLFVVIFMMYVFNNKYKLLDNINNGW